MVEIVTIFHAGTQKLRRDDGDWGESEVREAGQVPADIRSVFFPGEGKSLLLHFPNRAGYMTFPQVEDENQPCNIYSKD